MRSVTIKVIKFQIPLVEASKIWSNSASGIFSAKKTLQLKCDSYRATVLYAAAIVKLLVIGAGLKNSASVKS